MRIVRFKVGDDVFSGRMTPDGKIVSETAAGTIYHSAAEVQSVAPTVPTKVVAVGLNYHDHAEELGMPLPDEPLLFLKPVSSVVGPGEAIRLPPESSRVDYEAELAIVIGTRAYRVNLESARDHILGYTCLNDVTARDLQKKDGQWARAKGFDTFCPVGPVIETELDTGDLVIECLVNGETKQRSTTANLIFGPEKLVSFVSQVMTLLPGDIIATGTPSGIGPLQAGDTVQVRIEGIGTLTNPVETCS